MRRTATLFSAAALALIAAGCGDSNAPKDLAYGHYGLVSVDGQRLLVTLIDDPALKLTLTAGTLTLNANSTFTHSATLARATNGFPAAPIQLSCGGSFTRTGSTFTLTGNETAQCSGMTATGILDGSTFTVTDDEGETLVFRR